MPDNALLFVSNLEKKTPRDISPPHAPAVDFFFLKGRRGGARCSHFHTTMDEKVAVLLAGFCLFCALERGGYELEKIFAIKNVLAAVACCCCHDLQFMS